MPNIRHMAETFECPHCSAVYEITHETTASRDRDNATDCQVCGKKMDSGNTAITPRYELVKMPDGTSV